MAPISFGEIPLAGSFVYRIYGYGGQLLYVGLTDNLLERMESHHRSSDWWGMAARVTWERFRTRAEAVAVEGQTISRLCPEFNVNMNHQRSFVVAMGHTQVYPAAAWRRLGQVIRDRRVHRKQTQTSVGEAAGGDVTTVRQLERGVQTQYRRDFLEGLEAALDWRAGSIEAVLAAGEPVALTEEELTTRALEASRRLALGERL